MHACLSLVEQISGKTDPLTALSEIRSEGPRRHRLQFQPSVTRDQLENLHTLQFLKRKGKVVFLGQPGVCKTLLAISLAVIAAERGRWVYDATLADLITWHEDAQQAGHLAGRLRTFVSPGLTNVDEIGYQPISRTGAPLFYQPLSSLYDSPSLSNDVLCSQWLSSHYLKCGAWISSKQAATWAGVKLVAA